MWSGCPCASLSSLSFPIRNRPGSRFRFQGTSFGFERERIEEDFRGSSRETPSISPFSKRTTWDGDWNPTKVRGRRKATGLGSSNIPSHLEDGRKGNVSEGTAGDPPTPDRSQVAMGKGPEPTTTTKRTETTASKNAPLFDRRGGKKPRNPIPKGGHFGTQGHATSDRGFRPGGETQPQSFRGAGIWTRFHPMMQQISDAIIPSFPSVRQWDRSRPAPGTRPRGKAEPTG